MPWLSGYENSSPVRIGNAAYQQLQLDVFGEIADAMLQNVKAGMGITERGRALRPVILEYLARAWREPDEGIWEVRGGPQHFVHSKVMAWVAFDRAADAVGAEASETQLSDGERLPTKFMRKFASVDLTQSLTASCSPTAPSGSMPAFC